MNEKTLAITAAAALADTGLNERENTAGARAIVLDESDIDAIAEAVVGKLSERRTAWVTVEAVADFLGVAPRYVRDHADELGARRLPAPEQGRLRFRFDLVDAALSVAGRGSEDEKPTPQAGRPRGSRRRSGTTDDLLPFPGWDGAP